MAGDQELAVELLGTNNGLGQLGLWQPINSEVRKSEKFKQGLIDLGVRDYLMATGWNDFCHPIPDTENDFECN